MKKKRFIETMRVADPCTEDWDQMTGNDKVRFCGHCAKHVNNLSAMTRRDAVRLMKQSNGELCIRYVVHPETNSPVYAPQLVQIVRRAPLVAAGVVGATMALSSFTYAQGGTRRVHPEPTPTPQIEQPAESAQTREPADDEEQTEKPDPNAGNAIGVLSGRIHDEKDEAVTTAKVSLLDAEDREFASTTTDEMGMYKIENIPFAKYKLKVEAPGFVVQDVNLRIQEAERVADVPLAILRIVISGSSIIVRVRYESELMRAVEDDEIDKARDLIAAGADVNRVEDDDTTPIFVAVEQGNLEMVRMLLSFGAKLDIRDEEKRTPLMMIDEDASVELVQLLLKSGAKVNLKTEDGETPLILAAEANLRTEVLQALIDGGAELDAQDEEGRTALMEAANHENLENVRLLVLAGADINLRDKDGDNAWDFASEDEVEEFLVAHGVTIDLEDVEPEEIEVPEYEPEEPEVPTGEEPGV